MSSFTHNTFPSHRATAVFAALIACIAAVVWGVGCAGLSPSPSPTPTADTAHVAIANAQADTRAIGSTLTQSAAAITTQAQAARRDAADATLAVREAVAARADAIVGQAAVVSAQAAAIDPGVTRQLDTLHGQVSALEGQRAAAVDRVVTLTAALDEARDYGRWVPWLLLGIVVGAALIAVKAYPPLAMIPAELGGGVAGGCLVGLLYVHTAGRYPLAVAIAGGALVLVLVVPTVWRLNIRGGV